MAHIENTKTRMISGTFFLSLQPISAMLIGFLIAQAISKNIAPADLGTFSFLSMLYDWYTSIFLLMIPGAIIKYAGEYVGSGDQQKVNNLVKTCTLCMLIVSPTAAVISFFMTTFIFGILSLKIDSSILLIFCLATGSSIFVQLITAVGRGLQKLRKVGIIVFIGSIVAQAITWTLIKTGVGILSLVFRWLLANGIVIFLLVVSGKSLLSLEGDFFSFRKLVAFSLPLFISAMIAFVGQYSFLRIVLKNYFSLIEVGYFEFGMRLRIIVSTLALGYHYALAPYFATDYGYGGEKLVSKNLGWTVKFGAFVFSPLIIGAVAVGKIIFNIAFKEYLPAYPFFVVLVLGLWFVLLLRPFSTVLIAVGHPEKQLIARIISTMIGVSLTFLLARMGALGIAIVWIFMDTVWSCFLVFFCRKYIKIHVDWKKTFMFLISAIIALPVVLIEYHVLQDIYALFGIILTILLIYIIFVRVLGLITEREIFIALAFLPEDLRKKISRIISKY